MKEKAKSFEEVVEEAKKQPVLTFADPLLALKTHLYSQLLAEAEEKGIITWDEHDSLIQVDFILRGRLKDTKEGAYLVVEIFHRVHKSDGERAIERSKILSKILPEKCIPPLVGGEFEEDGILLAKEKGVALFSYSY